MSDPKFSVGDRVKIVNPMWSQTDHPLASRWLEVDHEVLEVLDVFGVVAYKVMDPDPGRVGNPPGTMGFLHEDELEAA